MDLLNPLKEYVYRSEWLVVSLIILRKRRNKHVFDDVKLNLVTSLSLFNQSNVIILGRKSNIRSLSKKRHHELFLT